MSDVTSEMVERLDHLIKRIRDRGTILLIPMEDDADAISALLASWRERGVEIKRLRRLPRSDVPLPTTADHKSDL